MEDSEVHLQYISLLTDYLEKKKFSLKGKNAGFPGGSVGENSLANAGDTGSISDTGRSDMPQSI